MSRGSKEAGGATRGWIEEEGGLGWRKLIAWEVVVVWREQREDGWGWGVTLCTSPGFHRRRACLGIFLICLDFWLLPCFVFLPPPPFSSHSQPSNPAPIHLSFPETLISSHFLLIRWIWVLNPHLSVCQTDLCKVPLFGWWPMRSSVCACTCRGNPPVDHEPKTRKAVLSSLVYFYLYSY